MNIFIDFDGTVVDSRKRVYALFIYLTKSTISFEKYWVLKKSQKSNQWVLKDILNFNQNKIEIFNSEWLNKIEDWDYLLMDELFPFSKNALERLSQKGTLHLITGRQSRKSLLLQLKHLGIDHYFQTVMNTANKSEKEIVIHEKHFSISPSDIFVGDTENEIQSGKKLGIRTISVLTGFRNRSVLLDYNPDHIVEHLNQVNDLIDSDFHLI